MSLTRLNNPFVNQNIHRNPSQTPDHRTHTRTSSTGTIMSGLLASTANAF